MKIKCWGARGSLPVSGKSFLKYGGDTTCLEIRPNQGGLVIVDAGSGIRRLGNLLVEEGVKHVNFLFTHAHWDHLMGFPFFKPLFDPAVSVRMQGCPFAQEYVKKLVSRLMAPPNFPIRPQDLKAHLLYEEACPLEFSIDSMKVEPVPLCHPNRGSGYRFSEQGKTFLFLTDNELDYPHPGGLSFQEYRREAEGTDLLIHDAEFTPEEYEARTRGWGHSHFLRTVELAAEAKVGSLGLFHHNQDRSDEDMERIVDAARDFLAKQGSGVKVFAVKRDHEFIL